jgi:hypothetical protein
VGAPLKGPPFKEGPTKWDPVFMRQKIELFLRNLTNWGHILGAPTLFHFVGAIFERGPQLKGLPLKEGAHKWDPVFMRS